MCCYFFLACVSSHGHVALSVIHSAEWSGEWIVGRNLAPFTRLVVSTL